MERWQCPMCQHVVPYEGLDWLAVTQHGVCPNGHTVWRIKEPSHVSGYSFWFLSEYILFTLERN